MKISGTTFLVTGGASGLGAATVRRLHALGARVVIADVAAAPGQALAAELGERARFVRTDVASEADGRAAVELARSTFGALHGLVNCAGIGPAERVLGREAPHRLESFVRCITINLVGTFNMLRLAAAAMAVNAPGEDGERGVIVNTASIAAYEGQIGRRPTAPRRAASSA